MCHQKQARSAFALAFLMFLLSIITFIPNTSYAASNGPMAFVQENPNYIYYDLQVDSIYHNGFYYCVVPAVYPDGTYNDLVLVSKDQKGWTVLTELKENGLSIPDAKKIRFLNGKWLIYLKDQKGEIVYTSSDGVSWERLDLHFRDVTYYDGKYWAVDDKGTIYYSEALGVWMRLTDLTGVPLTAVSPVDLCVTGNQIILSYYNPMWGKENLNNGLAVYQLQQSEWTTTRGYNEQIGATKELFWTGSEFILVYQNDYTLSPMRFYTSLDGISWTREDNIPYLIQLLTPHTEGDSAISELIGTLKDQLKKVAESNAPIPVLVLLNNQIIQFDQEALLKDGRVLVPVRKIFEVLGGSMTWSSQTKTVTGVAGNTTIQMTIGSKTVYLNNQPVVLDVPAQIIQDKTYVPVRFVADSLGKVVLWDKENFIVELNNK